MKGSLERVRAVVQGRLPDRPPLYELLRNDAVLSHFAGQTLTLENAAEVVFKAYEPAIDATRPLVRLPAAERVVQLEDGREQRHYRWTTWTQHKHYADSQAYASAKREQMAQDGQDWSPARQQAVDRFMMTTRENRRKLGEVFYFPSSPVGVGLMSIYGEVGLEDFSYYLADCPQVIEELMEHRTREAEMWIEHLPADHAIEAMMVGDDIAYKTGPMLSPQWFKEHYFHRLARVMSAWHRRGIRVMFHSDGNLNLLLDGLVEAGIDGLNPIETLAGMDIADIHRRYPHLFLAGGIDVSELLPHGTPDQVRDAVKCAIEAAQGRLLVGSTTELNDEVPLENYLAMRETVLEYRY